MPRQDKEVQAIDLESREALEVALHESRQINLAILDAVPARIFWKDKNLVYLGCNAAFARDAGFSDPEEVVGKDDYEMGWQRDQAESYRSDDRQVIETGSSKLLIEESQTTPDGKVELLTSKVPLRRRNGEIYGVLGTYLDVSGRARLIRLKDEIIFTVGHELRTPLTSVMASLSLLAGGVAGKLPDAAAHLVAVAHINSQ
ncbi:MAG: PAS domain-containing protein, partial [Arenicellales bacterium]